MKIKFLLVALVGLVVYQPMQALRVKMTTKVWSTPIMVVVDVKEKRDDLGYVINFDNSEKYDQSKEFEYPDSYNIAAVWIQYAEESKAWGFNVADLKENKIPVTGNHTIEMIIEDRFGRFGIVVDNGPKKYIQGKPVVGRLEAKELLREVVGS